MVILTITLHGIHHITIHPGIHHGTTVHTGEDTDMGIMTVTMVVITVIIIIVAVIAGTGFITDPEGLLAQTEAQ
jgi:hypothetical protein